MRLMKMITKHRLLAMRKGNYEPRIQTIRDIIQTTIRAQEEIKERRRMTDFEMIVKEFCIPMENEFICDELCDWDLDQEDESWCSRNCGVTNCGKYPEMNCYKEWVKMKRSDGE